MRKLLIAAAALSVAGGAGAQQRVVMPGPGAGYPPPMAGNHAPPPGVMQAAHPMPAPMRSSQQWGGRVNGRWTGGMRAPGGYAGYRRPYRGYRLPSYWVSPSFYISEWSGYGLARPPYGYNWARYYDDAVLIDGRGQVYDTVSGVDWDSDMDRAGGDSERYEADRGGYADGGADGRYKQQPGAGYALPQDGYYERRSYEHRSNGVGGALVGGAAGGIAGGLIAGHHDKVGGALVGAGAGALLGYAIDKGGDHRGYAPPPPPPPGGSGAGYPPPGYAPPPPPRGRRAPPMIVQSDGGSTVTTVTSGGGATYVNGGWYAPSTVTTVTIASAPVVTTTTEIFEDSVTYTRHAVRKAYHRRICRPVPRCACR